MPATQQRGDVAAESERGWVDPTGPTARHMRAKVREEVTHARLNATALAGDSHTGCRVRLGYFECGG